MIGERVAPVTTWRAEEAVVEWHCALDEAQAGLSRIHADVAVIAADYGEWRSDNRFAALLHVIGKVASRLGSAHGEIESLLGVQP